MQEVSKKDSFSQFVSDFNSNYLSYQKTLTQERRYFKSLKLKNKQLQLKSDFLSRNVQETKNQLLEKISLIKSLPSEDLQKFPKPDLEDLYQFLSINNRSPSFSLVFSKLDEFDPASIPESALKLKISESNIEENELNAVKMFVKLCIEWQMKNDLLKVYESEIQRNAKNIEEKKSKIEELEEKIEAFARGVQVDGNEYLETKEQQEEMAINSDELYGEMRIAADTSTIIFEERKCFGKCCFIL